MGRYDKEKASRADKVLGHYSEVANNGEGMETLMIDLLTDLRH